MDDFDRALSTRGRRDAPAIGAWIAANGTMPDLVMCSAARRAEETWDLVARSLSTDPAVETTRDLYLASEQSLRGLVRGIPSQYETVMLVGHNPGIHLLASSLIADGPPGLVEQLGRNYPTGALAGIALDIEGWADLRPGSGHLVDFVTPRDL